MNLEAAIEVFVGKGFFVVKSKTYEGTETVKAMRRRDDMGKYVYDVADLARAPEDRSDPANRPVSQSLDFPQVPDETIEIVADIPRRRAGES